METSTRGELVWDATDAAAPRWVLLLDQPGDDPRRLDPQALDTPHDASENQLRQFIATTLYNEARKAPSTVTLRPIEKGQRYQFRVTYIY